MALTMSDEDAPDFDVEQAFGELFTPNRTTDYNPHPSRTRTSWAFTIRDGNIKLPPPQWWLDDQDTQGRKEAKWAIWNNRYDYARQMSVWMTAPLADYRRAKFLRKASEYRL